MFCAKGSKGDNQALKIAVDHEEHNENTSNKHRPVFGDLAQHYPDGSLILDSRIDEFIDEIGS